VFVAGEIWALKTTAALLERSPEVIAAGEKLIAAVMPDTASAAARNIAMKAVDIARKTGIVPEELNYPLRGPLVRSGKEAEAQITFKPDGATEFLKGKVADYRKADDLFFAYKSKGNPDQISRSFQRGYLYNENAVSSFASIQRDQPMLAYLGRPQTNHGWANFATKERDAAREFIPDGSIPVGVGSKRQAWFTPKEEVVVLGPIQASLNVPPLLPSMNREVVGEKQFEWFPFGESDSVTRADVREVNHQFKMNGFYTDDTYTANYVRLMNGKVYRVDPEDLHVMGDKSWREYVAAHPES
jgi:hypothetical protein